MQRLTRVVAVAVVCACSKSRTEAPAGIQGGISLRSMSGCAAVERAIQDAAVQEMRHTLEGSLTGGVVGYGGGAAPAAAGPAAVTTTNVQVSGVDEADLIKTDGQKTWAIAGKRVHLLQAWPPEALQNTASVELEGWPSGLFVTPSSLAAISFAWATAAATATVCPPGAYCVAGSAWAKLTLLDPASLGMRAELWMPGSPAQTRRIGDQMYLVSNDMPRWPPELKWYVTVADPADRASATRAAEDANERIIRATPLASWLPPARSRIAGGDTVEVPYDCTNFAIGNAPVRLGFTTVWTVDLAHPDRQPARTTIAGRADMTYASLQSLYLLQRHWWWWEAAGNQDWTYVHKFDISQPGGARYVRSGGFPGFPVDSYGVDEHRGYLRAAVNTWQLTHPKEGLWVQSSSSSLHVLDADLQRVTSMEIVPSEWVYGSRFMGDRAFITTFHRVDPLNAIDLSDPVHPRIAGQLEVPGFSTYLHPIDDTHLLGVGVYLPESGGWQDRSVQLSVFDVSDLANPRRTAQAKVGTAWGYTEALWDPHAFNWFPEKDLLAIPVSDWSPDASGAAYWGSFSSDLRVFEVHGDSIASRGSVSLKDLYLTYGDAQWSWTWSPVVRRSVMASDADGSAFVYAFSDAGARVAPLGALGAPLATVPFAH